MPGGWTDGGMRVTVPDVLGHGEVQAVGGKLAVAIDPAGVTLVLSTPHPSIAQLEPAAVRALYVLLCQALASMP